MNWHELSNKYPLAVKRLCEANGWRVMLFNQAKDPRYGLWGDWGNGDIIHPFGVLCALDEEDIVTHIKPMENGSFFVGVKPVDHRPITVGIAKTRESAQIAAIPHALKALNDKLEKEAAG